MAPSPRHARRVLTTHAALRQGPVTTAPAAQVAGAAAPKRKVSGVAAEHAANVTRSHLEQGKHANFQLYALNAEWPPGSHLALPLSVVGRPLWEHILPVDGKQHPGKDAYMGAWDKITHQCTSLTCRPRTQKFLQLRVRGICSTLHACAARARGCAGPALAGQCSPAHLSARHACAARARAPAMLTRA